MNTNQLEYFIALAETLNFTKAAERCYISQTAMTQQIKSLEKIIGVPLFSRDKHHVELTAAGKVYLNEARVIISRSNEALKLARLVSEGTSGELTIGYCRGFGQSDFADPLRKFHQAYPSIKINLFCDNTSILFEALGRGDCDLILTPTPKIRDFADAKHKYIKSYPVLAVLPAGHPLSDREALTYKDLEFEDFIMMEPSNRPKDQMEESVLIYERGGYYPNIVGMEGNPETLILMICVGLGISIMPEYIMKLYQNDSRIRTIPLIKEDGLAENIDFEVNYLSGNMNPAVEHMLEMLE